MGPNKGVWDTRDDEVIQVMQMRILADLKKLCKTEPWITRMNMRNL